MVTANAPVRRPGAGLLLLVAVSAAFAVAGIVCAWLAYPLSLICEATYPNTCGSDPRLAPAIVGTIVLVSLSAISIGLILLAR
jgi:hypothetical protein